MRKSLPPYWLFQKAIVNWVTDQELGTQLPFPYRILGLYCYLYFSLWPTSDFLRGGSRLFYYISRLYSLSGQMGIRKIQIGRYSVFIDLLDARFLQVVNELKGNVPTRVLSLFLSEGDTFIDIGANHGAFSIIASHLIGPTGRVFAFEPQERLAAAVRQSLAQAPAEFDVFQIALGDRNEDVDLVVPLSYSGTAGLFAEFSGGDGYVLSRVALRRCDDISDWSNFKDRLFIKLDIEGSEYEFLKGASNMIRTRLPYILMEINPVAMKSAGTPPEDLLDLLKSFGYRKFCPETDLANAMELDRISFQDQHNILLMGGMP